MELSKYFGLLGLLVFSSFTVTEQAWSYKGDTGPAFWSLTYPDCGGSSQSPIDISSGGSTIYDPLLTPFVFTNYDNPVAGEFTVTNNGHSVMLTVPAGAKISISGATLPNTYTLEQFHFHWGSNNNNGSEHSIDGGFYPMEIHLVHYNSDLYPDFATASDKARGLAVLGITVGVNTLATFPELDELETHFSEIPFEGNETTMPTFGIRALLPASNTDFFRYPGSLTTPPCYESVIWTIFRTKVNMTPAQIAAFRTLRSNLPGDPEEILEDNVRPIQPLGTSRVVNSSF